MQSEGNSSPVRWTSQMSQSSLPARLSSMKIGAAEHQGGGGRMVVVGPGRGQSSRRAAGGLFVAVFHVGRVVVVGHDHRPPAIAAGNHHHQVALFQLALLVAQPAARPRESEIGLPVERQIADHHFARSCRPSSIVRR